jgi:SAM-dependent methyltransferase
LADARTAYRLDRAQLRASFERASAGYEAAARLQRAVAAELLARLAAFGFTPAVVLDLGCGTGGVAAELRARYPRTLVIALDLARGMLREARRHLEAGQRFERVCGDALRLPLKDASVDIVFSNLMLVRRALRRLLWGTTGQPRSTAGSLCAPAARLAWAARRWPILSKSRRKSYAPRWPR